MLYKITKYVQRLNLFINHFFRNSFNEKKFYKSLKNENFILFDLGSNLGTFTKFFLKNTIIKNLKIYSFEPNNDLFRLQKNIFKRSKNIVIDNLAMSNSVGKLNFYQTKISSQSSLKNNWIEDEEDIEKSYWVQTQTLDGYVTANNIEIINFLKIDCEGSDLDILKGAKNLLSSKKIRYIKIETYFQDEMKKNFQAINKFLIENDYELFGINNVKYINNELQLCDSFYRPKFS